MAAHALEDDHSRPQIVLKEAANTASNAENSLPQRDCWPLAAQWTNTHIIYQAAKG